MTTKLHNFFVIERAMASNDYKNWFTKLDSKHFKVFMRKSSLNTIATIAYDLGTTATKYAIVYFRLTYADDYEFKLNLFRFLCFYHQFKEIMHETDPMDIRKHTDESIPFPVAMNEYLTLVGLSQFITDDNWEFRKRLCEIFIELQDNIKHKTLDKPENMRDTALSIDNL